MKEDSQLNLLSNFSSTKGGKQSASTASSSGHGRSTSSSFSGGASRGSPSSKRSASPSPARRKVSFDFSVFCSPTLKKSFRK